MSDSAPIFPKTYDLLTWLIPHTMNFPRSQRFVVTKRLQDALLDFQEHIIEANRVRGNARVTLLRQADGDLDKVRLYLRLANRWAWVGRGPIPPRFPDGTGNRADAWRLDQETRRHLAAVLVTAAAVRGPAERRPCFARWRLRQPSKRRALRVPQQEQPEQQEQEQGFSGGGLHILPMPEMPGGITVIILSGRGKIARRVPGRVHTPLARIGRPPDGGRWTGVRVAGRRQNRPGAWGHPCAGPPGH